MFVVDAVVEDDVSPPTPYSLSHRETRVGGCGEFCNPTTDVSHFTHWADKEMHSNITGTEVTDLLFILRSAEPKNISELYNPLAPPIGLPGSYLIISQCVKQHAPSPPAIMQQAARLTCKTYLHRQVEQVFDHGDLPAGGRRVQRRVPPFVLAADLCPLTHQQTHDVQVACRGSTRAQPSKDNTNTNTSPFTGSRANKQCL